MAGDYYTITNYAARPVPVQRPHPPFLIGGGGRRTLSLAGTEADIVGLASHPSQRKCRREVADPCGDA